MNALDRRPVAYKRLRRITRDIDAEMSRGAGRPWQNPTLGQSQDVRAWIADPAAIHFKIIANLERFAGMLAPGARILDVGCYGGYCRGWLAQRVPGLRYVGIDINPATVAAAAALQAGPEAIYEVGDLFDLAPTIARHGPFDAALCLRVVIHTPWLDRSLAQLAGAAPIALVGLRIGAVDVAHERLDQVSGERHYFREFTAASVAAAVPAGVAHVLHPDRPYQSLVMSS